MKKGGPQDDGISWKPCRKTACSTGYVAQFDLLVESIDVILRPFSRSALRHSPLPRYETSWKCSYVVTSLTRRTSPLGHCSVAREPTHIPPFPRFCFHPGSGDAASRALTLAPPGCWRRMRKSRAFRYVLIRRPQGTVQSMKNQNFKASN